MTDTGKLRKQTVPAEPRSHGFSEGEDAYVIQLAENDSRRSNLVCVNTNNDDLRVLIDIFEDDGTLLESASMVLAPWSQDQIDQIFADYAPTEGYVRLSTDTQGGRGICHGTTLDNGTNDPAYEPGRTLEFAANEYYLPDAANSALEETALALLAPDGPALARVDLFRTGHDNTLHVSQELPLSAGVELRLANLLGELFDYSGTAAIRITAESGEVLVSSQTEASSPLGSSIRHVPVSPTSDQAVFGEKAVLIHLTENAIFWTSVGIVNTSPVVIDLDLVLHGGLGNVLGSIPVQLQPYGHIELYSVFAAVGFPAVIDGFLTIATRTAGGSFIAYATVTDPRTMDAYHVEMTRMPSEIFADGFESGDFSSWSAFVL